MRRLSKLFLISTLFICTFFISSDINAEESTNYENPIVDNQFKETGQNVEFKINENSIIILDTAYVDNSFTVTTSDFMDSKARGALSYFKTITISRDTPSFPKTTDYKEYSNGAWYAGTLYFQSSRVSGNKYIATYSGTLFITLG